MFSQKIIKTYEFAETRCIHFYAHSFVWYLETAENILKFIID